MQLRSKSDEQGSSAIEFVLILPIFLLLFFSMMEYGRYFYARVLVSNASTEVASAISRGVFATGSPSIPGTDGTVLNYVNKVLVPNLEKLANPNPDNPGAVTVNVYQTSANGLSSPLTSSDIKLACSEATNSTLISVEISTPFTPLTKPIDLVKLIIPSNVTSKATQRCIR